jgi:hypothetical protein
MMTTNERLREWLRRTSFKSRNFPDAHDLLELCEQCRYFDGKPGSKECLWKFLQQFREKGSKFDALVEQWGKDQGIMGESLDPPSFEDFQKLCP